MVVNQLVIVAVAALIGAFPISHARRQRERARRLSGLVASGSDGATAAGERTVAGPVEVERPAEPERSPPDRCELDRSDADPAVWAWRVQTERNRDEGSNDWKTIDSGLAVGEFAVRDDWERVRIDAESVRPGEIDDPFEADRLFLGTPDIDLYVEEHSGSLGDIGPVEDVEVSLGIGSETTTPNKYQATVIREGDELLARGRIDDAGDGAVLRDDSGIELGFGDLSDRVERLHSSARRWAAVGGGILALGVAGAVAGLVL
ncbi:hypothetical protein GRX03_14215 [Halovenus sp. WSH3]|uniref:Uncharacterized protein n=1 Tax=Halovenus carboxidivorans TaxID=2692199 RepID=A0A6B0T3W6_9EURY|nr:hypothetical protein [Halovenus carboxidivorans]MXR52755.1 hypothetical protein [Halovenus carboxidivorans]